MVPSQLSLNLKIYLQLIGIFFEEDE